MTEINLEVLFILMNIRRNEIVCNVLLDIFATRCIEIVCKYPMLCILTIVLD